MGIRIERELCVGCGACVESCPGGALTLSEGLARLGEGCTACGLCVGACPTGAVSMERESRGEGRGSGVWVFCQQEGGRLLEVSYELLGAGRAIADAMGAELTALVLGARPEALTSLIHRGADAVLLAEGEALLPPLFLTAAGQLSQLIRRRRPAVVLFGATAFGRALAPRVAAELRVGLTADCTELALDADTGLLRQTRPAFGGNLMATIVCPDARPQMATVRPGVMRPLPPDAARTGRIEQAACTAADAGARLLRLLPGAAGERIAAHRVLVVAGRGIGEKKNLRYVRRLAELLGGGYGVSRPLIDAGWAEYPHQVGQTGSTVAPKLLLSLGVSGAIQHLAGIGGAETIVAVNTDPTAPIFGAATHAVVGDCVEFMKALIGRLAP